MLYQKHRHVVSLFILAMVQIRNMWLVILTLIT
uniref:Uncharacterized protein n=1 Tax=Arundo donax TaxID=35708 RepID=A0A0A8ZSC8_ARUDO